MKADMILQKDIVEEMRWIPVLRSAKISVSVYKGIVTLTGNVDHYSKKKMAELAVLRVAGVKSLITRLIVISGSRHCDAESFQCCAGA